MSVFKIGNNFTTKDVENNSQIFKDYVKKISQKIDDANKNQVMKCKDFNAMIVWFNWCFYTRNDFFVSNLQTQCIKNILQMYNQIKSNMLNEWENDLFNHITLRDFKLLKFLLHQYINQFDSLTDDFNMVLKNVVSKESIQNCITQINIYINDNAEYFSAKNNSKHNPKTNNETSKISE